MQQPVQHPRLFLSSPGRSGNTLRTLSLWAALLGFGTALGCGAEAPVGPSDNASVQNSLTPMCVSETQGGPTSCKDEKTWSTYAAMSCAGKGLTLTKIGYSDGCGVGLYRQTNYECCTTTPTPPTPMCIWSPETMGSCLLPDEWKKQGATFCAAHGLSLNDLKLDRVCIAGGYGSAQFECCSPPTPPPPPTTMCTTQTLASMTCVADATWKTRAEAACKARMQTVGTVAFGTACMGGHQDIKFECCGAVTPPPPPPPTMCSGEALASMTCVDDATWKSKAEATCTAKKLTLGTLAFGTACMGGHQDIKFECCSTTTPPPPTPMCSGEAIASMTCIDDTTWKTKAEATCKARMQTLGSVSLGTACMGGHLDIKFECCGPVTPPPPPTMCTGEALRSTTCVDDVSWKRQAEAACTAKKLTLGTLAFGTACMGGHQDIKFECCGTTTPPPPGPMCITQAESTMTCVDDVSWKTRAEATCKAKMLTLTAISYGTACMGGHTDVKYECCSTTTTPPTPMCTTDKAPSPASCQTPDRWKVQGEAFCTAKHQSLSGLTLSGACTGGFSEAQFLCCPTTTPPPTTSCTGGILGDGRTCNTETALKTQAEDVCKMAGTRLTGFAAYDGCAMTGGYLHAKYQCCK